MKFYYRIVFMLTGPRVQVMLSDEIATDAEFTHNAQIAMVEQDLLRRHNLKAPAAGFVACLITDYKLLRSESAIVSATS